MITIYFTILLCNRVNHEETTPLSELHNITTLIRSPSINRHDTLIIALPAPPHRPLVSFTILRKLGQWCTAADYALLRPARCVTSPPADQSRGGHVHFVQRAVR